MKKKRTKSVTFHILETIDLKERKPTKLSAKKKWRGGWVEITAISSFFEVLARSPAGKKAHKIYFFLDAKRPTNGQQHGPRMRVAKAIAHWGDRGDLLGRECTIEESLFFIILPEKRKKKKKGKLWHAK